MSPTHRQRIQSAWEGRVSGCILGKPVELLSMQRGHAALSGYLERAGALPLRDYVPFERDDSVPLQQGCCRGHIRRAEADDDINYTVLALLMLEEQGLDLTTEAVARGWLRLLPAGWVFTAELAAYKVLLAHAADFFALGAPPGFDLAECSDNEWNEWIGAADMRRIRMGSKEKNDRLGYIVCSTCGPGSPPTSRRCRLASTPFPRVTRLDTNSEPQSGEHA